MIRSIFVNFSARLTMQVMYFCTLLLTTHFLGKDVRGEISIIQLSINMIHLVSDIVGGPSLVYLVPRAKRSTVVITGWSWAAGSSVITWSVLCWLNAIPSGYAFPVLIAAFLLSLNSINMNILLGQERIRQYNILLYLQGLLMFCTMAGSIFLLGHKHSVPYLDACYVAYAGCFLLGLYYVLTHEHHPKLGDNRNVYRVMFTTGLFTQLATLSFQLSIRFNYYKIDQYIHDDHGTVGIYSTAVSLAEAILLFSASVAAVLMSRISNEKLSEYTRRKTLQLSKLSAGVTIPGILIFVLLPAGFYSVLLGKDFSPVRDSFITLIPGVISISFGTVFGHYFSGIGKHYMNFFSASFALLITLLTGNWLISRYGILGAGWSASIAYGSLSVFIFTMFMLVGRNAKNEWRELIPTRNDLLSLKEIFSRENSADKQPEKDKASIE